MEGRVGEQCVSLKLLSPSEKAFDLGTTKRIGSRRIRRKTT
jgi:hypothetical protein